MAGARRAVFIAPFEELSEPKLVAELAARAEAKGWDGFFVWDHFIYPDVTAIADPWITLAAVAMATERVIIGTLVTPLPRRRPHQLARETATLDRLSGGRLVLGVGIGSDRTGEFAPGAYGEEPEPRARARLLDDGLQRVQAYWAGEFEPRPVGRIPIWVATHWPHRRPLKRAARHDGLFPVDLPGPEALAELKSELPERDGFDYVVTNPAGTDPQPWIDAGATWCLSGFGRHPTGAEVRAAIDAA
jgi:alkanesulfonate monooxygenase SsuD/methylene tetrahydromethanopterin reductase-like flavin-dependent oxidoreductase (luciferase family)